MSKYIIVIGLTRSGTTFITNLLGRSGEFKVEVEPHALWKSGNYQFFNDEEYDVSDKITSWIRGQLTKDLGEKRLLEKSPINSIRPKLVYGAFPDAKIIYIERDPVRCIYSNYVRSLKNDSFKPSITLRKYFLKTGSKDLPYAMSKRIIFSQIKFSEITLFLRYVLYMVWVRTWSPKSFPFGPKLKGFRNRIDKDGILKYHVDVFKKSKENKNIFKQLYGDKMKSFKMEQLMRNSSELEKLYQWAEIDYISQDINEILNNVDEDRKKKSVKESKIDSEIEKYLSK